jgi:hypothetical protein
MKQIINGIWNASPLEINMSLLIVCIVLAAILFAFLHWLNK